MRILIINQHVSDVVGGSEIQCDYIARGLTKRGHEILYGAVGPKYKKDYPDLPYTVFPLSLGQRKSFNKLLQDLRPDVIYWRFNKNYLLPTVLTTNAAGIPFVFAVSHINDTKRFAYKESTRKGIVRVASTVTQAMLSAWHYRGFAYVDAVTVNNGQHLNKLPVPQQRIIWNAVSVKRENFSWRKQYCVWVANIKASKRPEVFVQLAKDLTRRFPHIDFLMVGNIQDSTYNEYLRKAEQDNPAFHYLGFKKPEIVNGILEKALCLIHTARTEGFSNNLIQAWAQGIPVVTLEFDPENIINENNFGFVSGTVNNLIHDVAKLLTDDSQRKNMGEQARIFSRKNFSQDRLSQEVESFLTHIINTHQSSSR